ncbi:MAG: hypothetical protein JWO38_6225 [Gemmataceae bacterium]|nr:hypothetical protein [Gemmataceae bacterium]
MPTLPPSQMVLDTLQHDVLPAAGGAALVMCIFLFFGRWAAALGSAVAVVVGFAWANYTFGAVSWEGTGRLVPWVPDRYVWHWLPRAALVLVLVGLLSRWLGLLAGLVLPERRWWGKHLLVWAARVSAVGVVSGWLVPTPAAGLVWVRPVLAAVMLIEWAALDGIARSGAGGQVAAYLSAIFFAAAAVLIYHHWSGAMEMAVVLGCAFFGVAVAAGAGKADASGAIPAGVGFLPGLLLNGRFQVDSQVPLASFWLVALTPLVLTPFLIPRLNRQNGWLARTVRAAVVLIPLVVAGVMAAQHEKLAYEDEEAGAALEDQ